MSDIMDSIIDRDTILIVIAIVLVMIIGWFIGTLNRLRKYRVIIKESQKNVDIALAKRYDTICQMFKVAQSFAKYEKNNISGFSESKRRLKL